VWIVRLALNRPYTFVVLSLLIVILSGVAIVQTPVDIFPDINIPVVGVIINYSGLNPQDMQDRLSTVLERGLTTVVDDIEHSRIAKLPRDFDDQGIFPAGRGCVRRHCPNLRPVGSFRPRYAARYHPPFHDCL